MEVSGLLHAPAALPRQKSWRIGGRTGPRVIHNELAWRKMRATAGNQTAVQAVTRALFLLMHKNKKRIQSLHFS
jgi:hypothetical protein